jgi:ribonuclease R
MKKRKPSFISENTSNNNKTLKVHPASSKKTQKNQITVLGWIDRSTRHTFVLRPFDKDFHASIVLKRSDLKNHDCKMHTIVRAALRKTKGSLLDGTVVEVFPSIDDPELEKSIVVESNGIPDHFTDDVKSAAQTSRELKPGRRTDLTHLSFVTIDGETAKDFDDAIYVEEKKDGTFHLIVSIADVSHYVRPRNALDNEAFNRGTSVYFPGDCIPMLPEELSNDLCSLVPNQPRLCLSCDMVLSRDGEIVSTKIYPSTIRSVARLTYTTVSKVVEKGQSELVSPALARMLESALKLSLVIRKNRTDRGALDLDLPETQIDVNDFGDVVGFKKSDRNEAHKLIEDFMILANEAVSEAIEFKGFPSIYRVHEDPDPEKLDRLDKVLKRFGFSLSKKDNPVDSLQAFLDTVRGHKDEKILVTSLLRSLKQAQYSAKNLGHFGLGSESYTHFTSPIRRYPDLMVHRILRESDFLASNKPPYSMEQLDAISRRCSETERRAFLAERAMEDIKQTRFMASFVGKTFKAVIVSVKEFGLFVELEDYPVQGLIPLRYLPIDGWHTDELEICLKGSRNKGTFWLGDIVQVQLVDADRFKRQVTFRYLKHVGHK